MMLAASKLPRLVLLVPELELVPVQALGQVPELALVPELVPGRHIQPPTSLPA